MPFPSQKTIEEIRTLRERYDDARSSLLPALYVLQRENGWLSTESGQLISIDLPRGLTGLAAGETFARLTSSDGNIFDITAPMTGVVKMLNEKANEAVFSLARDYRAEGWFLWLARIETLS